MGMSVSRMAPGGAGEAERFELVDAARAAHVVGQPVRVPLGDQRGLLAALLVEQGDPDRLEGHDPAQRVEQRLGALLDPAGHRRDTGHFSGDPGPLHRQIGHLPS